MSASPSRLEIVDLGSNAISVSGELDAYTAPTLAERFATLTTDDGDVLVDLAGVTFIGSSGLHVLIELQQRLGASPSGLVLRSPSPTVLRLFEIVGLGGHFTIAP